MSKCFHSCPLSSTPTPVRVSKEGNHSTQKRSKHCGRLSTSLVGSVLGLGINQYSIWIWRRNVAGKTGLRICPSQWRSTIRVVMAHFQGTLIPVLESPYHARFRCLPSPIHMISLLISWSYEGNTWQMQEGGPSRTGCGDRCIKTTYSSAEHVTGLQRIRKAFTALRFFSHILWYSPSCKLMCILFFYSSVPSCVYLSLVRLPTLAAFG